MLYITAGSGWMMTETPFGTARIVENEIEFERFVDRESDTILPFYRLPLTGEHLAAWAVRALRQSGCRCKRIGTVTAAAKRSTREDSNLVYYVVYSTSATLIRGGKEQGLTFNLSEEETGGFIHFITDLICDTPTQTAAV
jgi:hypothetical protein